MCGERSGFTPAGKWKFRQERVGYTAADFRERITVKKQKGRGAMALKQERKSAHVAGVLPIVGGFAREFLDYGRTERVLSRTILD